MFCQWKHYIILPNNNNNVKKGFVKQGDFLNLTNYCRSTLDPFLSVKFSHS